MDDPERLERESDDVARKAHFLFAPLFLLGSESALIAPAFLDLPGRSGSLADNCVAKQEFGQEESIPLPLRGRSRRECGPVAAPVRLRLMGLRTGQILWSLRERVRRAFEMCE
jgi:hypothetical protein